MASEPNLTSVDPYSVLGVDRFATPAQIKAAYRRAIRSAHPDLADQTAGATAAQINSAYELLSRGAGARQPRTGGQGQSRQWQSGAREGGRRPGEQRASDDPPATAPTPRRPVSPDVWGDVDHRLFVAPGRMPLTILLAALCLGLAALIAASIPSADPALGAVLGSYGPLLVFALFFSVPASPVARVPEFLLLSVPIFAVPVLWNWSTVTDSDRALARVYCASLLLIAIDIVARLLARQYRFAREANAWQNLVNLNHEHPGSEIIWAPGLRGLATTHGAWMCFSADDRVLGRAPGNAIASFGMLARKRSARK